jgi:phospholipid/cholesterol/gamma-HCH transport system substrate-binding protein
MIQRADDNDRGAAAPARNRISPQEMTLVQPTRSPRREVQVGIFVLAGILAVLAALFILTDPGTFRGRYYVTTIVRDAGGIRARDPVQLAGVNIGRVDDLKLTGQGVRMRLEIEGKYHFPDDSKVRLTAKGLLGEMVADVLPGRSRTPAEEGDVLASADQDQGLSGTAQDLAGTAKQVGGRADTLLARANLLLSQEAIGSVHTSAAELQSMLGSLQALAADQRVQLAALSSSLRRSAAGIEGAATRPELARAIARTDTLTARLDVATSQLSQASASMAVVMGRMERGEGTLGKLSKDDSLYNNLNSAVTNLSQLTNDIRANPKKYLSVSVF